MIVTQYEDVDQDRVTVGSIFDVEEILSVFDILKGRIGSSSLPTVKLFLKLAGSSISTTDILVTPPLRTPPSEELFGFTTHQNTNYQNQDFIGGIEQNYGFKKKASVNPLDLTKRARSNSFTPPLRTPPPSPPHSRAGKQKIREIYLSSKGTLTEEPEELKDILSHPNVYNDIDNEIFSSNQHQNQNRRFSGYSASSNQSNQSISQREDFNNLSRPVHETPPLRYLYTKSQTHGILRTPPRSHNSSPRSSSVYGDEDDDSSPDNSRDMQPVSFIDKHLNQKLNVRNSPPNNNIMVTNPQDRVKKNTFKKIFFFVVILY